MGTPAKSHQPHDVATRPRVRIADAHAVATTRAVLASLRVHTVCQEAACPNRWECFGRRTATFLILGAVCTRGCAFCNMRRGAPDAPDPEEPARVAQAAAALRLAYVVLTSVTRDDVPDGGAAHFVDTIRAVRAACPGAGIEVLTPDFGGDPHAIARVLQERPTVFNHNVETVARLTPVLRVRATYQRSLAVLEHAGRCAPVVPRKSGLMVGVGETAGEVRQTLADLRRVGCSIVTIGQYLPPSPAHYPLRQRVSSAGFAEYEQMARACGFAGVACGPLVRSSYHAAQTFAAAQSQCSPPECMS